MGILQYILQLFTTLYIVYTGQIFLVMKFIYTLLALFLLLTIAHAQDAYADAGSSPSADAGTWDANAGTSDADAGADADSSATWAVTTQAVEVLNDDATDAADDSGSDAGTDDDANNQDAGGDDATAGFACMSASSMFTALAVGIVAAYNF